MKKLLLPIVLVTLFGSVAGMLWLNTRIEKVVVVDVVKLFNEFELKKETEKRMDEQLRLYKSKIDSIQAIAARAEKEKDEALLERSTQVLMQMTLEFQNAADVSAQNINEVVWKRLNPLIDEFGRERGYRIIIGANGMGSVLYNDQAVDRTAELIEFINKKYQNGL